MPLPDLHKFQILKFVHKFIHHQDQLSSVYSYHFNKNRIFYSYNTRAKDDRHSQSFKVHLGKDLPHIQMLAILWNALPEELKGIVSATKICGKFSINNYVLPF